MKLNDQMQRIQAPNGRGIRNLDLELLRTFIAVADCGGFTRAAERLFKTQSTVSQQIQRLEGSTGLALLDRNSRQVTLTEEGESLLGYAKRILELNDEVCIALGGGRAESAIRLGVPEDFATEPMTSLLAEFARDHPRLRLEVTCDLSARLQFAYDQQELDIAIVKQRIGSRSSTHAWPERLCWIDSRAFPVLEQDPLPLAVFPLRGLYRDEIQSALDACGRRWRVSYCSTSLGSLQSAVANGLGISLLPARAVDHRHRVPGPDHWLPQVNTIELALHCRPAAGGAVHRLAERLASLCRVA